MLYSVLSGVAAFLVCAVLLRIFIPILRRVKLGQKILEIGPSWHKSKEGTPIMGGLFFSIAITAAAVAFSLLSGSLPLRTLLVLGFALLFLCNGQIIYHITYCVRHKVKAFFKLGELA